MRQTRLRGGKAGARKQLCHADDAIHGSSQLVAHPVQEVALRLRGLLELAIRLDQLARAQRDLRFQALLLDDYALEPDPLQPHAMGNQCQENQRIQRVGPRGLPGSGRAMQLQPQRRLAPH